uniref:Oligopeptidase F N-terminal domain-containing protein n=1 Tax=Virgibacillus oceani TaxID=1479511 RepID=A0A917M3S6_9BACI|nr:hypothetical protein GCM10011398_19860 [Virgibacillus oceani]
MTAITQAKRWNRSEVPEEQTWNLNDLFTSDQEWEDELAAVQADVDQITDYKGKLGTDADTLLNCLVKLENYEKRLIKAATYASLKASADGADPKNQGDSAKVSAALANIGAKLSFVESELLTLSNETIQQFSQEKPSLQTYQKMLEDVLEKKPYTLSPEIEETLAALSEVHDAPYMIYQRSKSSDMDFPSIQDEEGNEHPMSAALYEDRFEITANTDLRRKAYDSFISTLDHYKNTYAAAYATEVTKQVTISRLRSYDSVTDMLLQSQQVTTEMYHNQLNIIQKELAPHMRKFAKLK